MPAPIWKATLKTIGEGDDGPVERLRLHTRTGRPLGSDAFLRKIETFLGRRVRARPRGRPKGSKDSIKRTRRKIGRKSRNGE
jgi:hypothetical protein